jgi:hypothetical protein
MTVLGDSTTLQTWSALATVNAASSSAHWPKQAAWFCVPESAAQIGRLLRRAGLWRNGANDTADGRVLLLSFGAWYYSSLRSVCGRAGSWNSTTQPEVNACVAEVAARDSAAVPTDRAELVGADALPLALTASAEWAREAAACMRPHVPHRGDGGDACHKARGDMCQLRASHARVDESLGLDQCDFATSIARLASFFADHRAQLPQHIFVLEPTPWHGSPLFDRDNGRWRNLAVHRVWQRIAPFVTVLPASEMMVPHVHRAKLDHQHWCIDSAQYGEYLSSVLTAVVSVVEPKPSQADQAASDSPRPLTFWSSDLHEGLRVELPATLMAFKHKIIMAGKRDPDGAKNPAPYSRAASDAPEVYHNPLLSMLPHRDISHLVNLMWDYSKLQHALVEDQFHRYRQLDAMRRADAFVCAFPSAFCESYMPFNRSVVWLAAHRIAMGRCSSARVQRLVRRLKLSMEPATPGRPQHVVAAMSRYDQEYIAYYAGKKPPLLEALAMEQLPRMRPWGERSLRPEILIGPLRERCQNLSTCIRQEGWLPGLSPEAERASGVTFTSAKALYSRYTLQQIGNHRAVVLLPYAMFTISITELYALGVPIFVPDLDIVASAKKCVDATDRQAELRCASSACAQEQQTRRKCSQPINNHEYVMGWDRTVCVERSGRNPIAQADSSLRHPNTHHPYSPEDESLPARRYWIRFADYFQWPHVRTFSSFADLVAQLEDAPFHRIHAAMLAHNLKRRAAQQEGWRTVFDAIRSTAVAGGRRIPTNITPAMHELWGERPFVDPLSRRCKPATPCFWQ